MSFKSKLTNVVNDVEENQNSIADIYSSLDEVSTELSTKQDELNVLSTITINEVKANSSIINGNMTCSTLTLNGSDIEESLNNKQDILTFENNLVLNSIVVKPSITKGLYTEPNDGQIICDSLMIGDDDVIDLINASSSDSQVTTNTNDIATLTSQQNTNTSNIATNTNDIATLTSQQNTNTSNIATLTSSVSSLGSSATNLTDVPRTYIGSITNHFYSLMGFEDVFTDYQFGTFTFSIPANTSSTQTFIFDTLNSANFHSGDNGHTIFLKYALSTDNYATKTNFRFFAHYGDSETKLIRGEPRILIKGNVGNLGSLGSGNVNFTIKLYVQTSNTSGTLFQSNYEVATLMLFN